MRSTYDKENQGFRGETVVDHYGRTLPRSAHGTASLGTPTSSGSAIMAAVLDLFERIINPELTARRVNVTVTWFLPLQRAENEVLGQYFTAADTFERLDPYERLLYLKGQVIPMDDLADLRREAPHELQ